MKATKVKLDCGFVGYVPAGEWFLIGSEVEAFDKIPKLSKDSRPCLRVVGRVSDILPREGE